MILEKLNKYSSILIIAGFAILFAIFIMILKNQSDIQAKQQEIQNNIIEFKKMEDGIVRLESRYVSDSDELRQKLKDMGVNIESIEKDMKDNNAQLTAIGVILAHTPGTNKKDLPSSWTQPAPSDNNTNNNPQPQPVATTPSCLSEFGYCDNIQGFNLEEPTGINNQAIPFGSVAFNSRNKNPWSVNVFPRTYSSVLTFGTDENNRVIAYARMTVESNGKTYQLNIDKAYYNQVYEDSRFYWWSPRLLGHYGIGINNSLSVVSKIGVSLYASSYTANKSRPHWMFFGLSTGYDISQKDFAIGFSPVAYNIMPNTNIVQNLYIAPEIGMHIKGNPYVSANFGLLF